MLDTFYAIFFRADATQRNGLAGLSLGMLSCVVLAFNAAGQLHVGFLGLLGLMTLFLGLGALGCYWYMASVHLLSAWLGQTSRQASPLNSRATRPWLSTLQGLWPFILLGPAVSVQRWWTGVGNLMTLGILLSSGFTLVSAIRRAYDIHWIQASLCLLLTVILGAFALMGLLGWPVMFLLGAKNFSIAIPVYTNFAQTLDI
ncbi:hypothetical protein [Altericista sp. CCNU0014]|uniref:hypothetical protein n=1 Tax=Altericista sp. CCNU0014 TaxID=3082949 RepID=UPI00384CE6F5